MSRPTRHDLRTKLRKAIEQNDVESAQTVLAQESLLANRISQVQSDKYQSFLLVAAEQGFVEIGKLLIQAKANVNQQCFEGKTPLIVASASGHVELVQLLLEQPEININLFDDLRQTPLHHATANNHQSIVKLLIDNKATTENGVCSTSSRIALIANLTTSVQKNNIESVQSILAQEPWLVNRLIGHQFLHTSLLFLAAAAGFADVLRVLISYNANINQQCGMGQTALCTASIYCREDVVAVLLAQPDVDVDIVDDARWTSLIWASARGHTGVVQQLLDADANPECAHDGGFTSLLRAVCNGRCATMRLLLQHRANVNQQNELGVCSLFWAAQHAAGDILEALLEANAIVDLPGFSGQTPLFAAAQNGHLVILRRLVAAGADVHFRSNKLQTALHGAAAFGHVAVVDELLTSAGADAGVTDCSDETPLHGAARGGHANCILSLLAAKADINAVNKYGNTPLIVAIDDDCCEAAQCLLERGAAWQTSGANNARHVARTKSVEIQSLFNCSLCGWTGMCCAECRKKYCIIECDKYANDGDCRLHRKLAHQALLEWALAMSSLNLPPYVLEHIFNSLHLKQTNPDYQQRKGIDFLTIPAGYAKNRNKFFFHLLVEEREHSENIQLFIAIQKFRNAIKTVK